MLRFAVIVAVFTLLSLVAFAQELPAFSTAGPHVVVNGVPLSAKPVERQGTLMLPMRAVFEALGADVKWDGPNRQITATRGEVVIVLWMNETAGTINDRPILLAVAPTAINNVTHVPLRFPAEAFGGEVKWLAKQQTAIITLGGNPAPNPNPLPNPDPNPTPNPNPTPMPLPANVIVLVEKLTAPVPALLVSTAGEAEPSLVQITKNAVITRTLASQTQPTPAVFADLQVGDQLTLTLDNAGRATRVEAIYARTSGKVAGFANKRLMMEDGNVYTLSPGAALIDAAGNAMKEADLKTGLDIDIFLIPNTTSIWKVILPGKGAVIITPINPGGKRDLRIITPADKSKYATTVTIAGESDPGASIQIVITYDKKTKIIPLSGEFYRNILTASDTGVWTTGELKTSMQIVGTPDTMVVTVEQLDAEGKAVKTITLNLSHVKGK